VKEEHIRASQIADYVRMGKVAVFDATELLGKELFNLTMPEIARLHGEAAREIPVYRQQGASAPGRSGFEDLASYSKRIAQWRDRGEIRYPEYRPWGPETPTQEDRRDSEGSSKEPWWLGLLSAYTGAPLAVAYKQLRTNVLQCAINTRRLDKLPIPKVEEALGSPSWLERAWSMFWLGPVGDCWHYDDPDNLLIGVHGDMWVTVFEQQDAEAMRAGGDRGCWSALNPLPQTFTDSNVMRTDPWVKKFPFIHFKLEPGMGVIVPSGTFHSLTMPDGDRILMNVFMNPKFKALHDAPASKYSFYNERKQTDEYAAMRSLKASTIYRVWDKHKIGGWFENTKLEML